MITFIVLLVTYIRNKQIDIIDLLAIGILEMFIVWRIV